MNNSKTSIAIVGGSLAGLTLALACSARGLAVHVIERSQARVQGGDSLGVDLAAIALTTGHDPRQQPALPVVPAYRDRHLTTWPALYAWLHERASKATGVTFQQGANVSSVTDLGDQVQLQLSNGAQHFADVAIGADGYNSVVRRAIVPADPLARYAGYLVWRGLIEERMLTRPVAWPSQGGLWIDFAEGYRLVAAVLPGRDGSLAPGQRQVTFAWFDAHQDDLLRRTGCLTEDGFIVGTLGRHKITPLIRIELLRRVAEQWPDPWAEAVSAGVQSLDALSGAPIAEYMPKRLASGRLALIGDAAHVVSPMTGRGFVTGVEDAAMLAQALADRQTQEPAALALARYEEARLPFVQGLVRQSRQISAEYLHLAVSRRRLEHHF
ncbi:MAG: FAD-dependent monooxygenase [Curvibacter lanceolatus]|uniref:FAD-dependent monooxygenase n=1 Tax=Curvibacter lanceolatus TaxID=86182 RepID=UPI0004CF6899|nr:FAD-dependent monooxygenase [Curvibacter lanceolatus]MBV5295452.1 FAD-dependent monooxygenase [Curvibacter lanceolatus]